MHGYVRSIGWWEQWRFVSISWDKICCPKGEGGLGIQKKKDANFGFLTKQG